MKKIDINEDVTVRLSEQGYEYITQYETNLRREGIEPHNVFDYEFLENGDLKITLWCLMKIFGPKMMLGNYPMFEGGICFNEDVLRDVEENTRSNI